MAWRLFEGLIHELPENEVEVDGKPHSVYIGDRVSLAYQSPQVHGPAKVGNDTFVGMQALVFRAELGNRVVVEPGAKTSGSRCLQGGRRRRSRLSQPRMWLIPCR